MLPIFFASVASSATRLDSPPRGAPDRQQRLTWFLCVVGFVVLLVFFSAGFFIYTAVVVALVLVLSVILASISLLGVQIQRRVSHTEMALGEVAEIGLVVKNTKNFPAFWVFGKECLETGLDVEGGRCFFNTIAGNEKQELTYRLHSLRRGVFRIGPTVLEVSGPVGLVRRFLVGSDVDFLTVFPKIVELQQGFALGQRPIHEVPRRRSIFEDPARFIGMREYQPGDSMRAIHWRATARSGTLQVKLFEPAILTGMILAVDMWRYAFKLLDKEAGDPVMELMITTAASLAEYVLRGDQEIGLISNGIDGAERYGKEWQGGTFQRLEQALEQTQHTTGTNLYQPVEIPAGKGIGQFERMNMGLARLIAADSIRLSDLLNMELPRLPINKVLMVITPSVDVALFGTLESIRRSGIEVGIIWIRAVDDVSPIPEGLPANVPFYIVQSESDIETLAGHPL